jgi:hypothetical protein
MTGKVGRLCRVGVVGVGLLLPATAGAWPFFDGTHPKKCPKPSYSPLYYWVPACDRFYAFHCRPRMKYIFPKDYYPELPIYFVPIPYRCVPVPPEIFTSNYPWFPKPPGQQASSGGGAPPPSFGAREVGTGVQ